MEALATLAPYLSGQSLEQALRAALRFEDEASRAQALATLAPHLPGAWQVPVLELALETVEHIGVQASRSGRTRLLSCLTCPQHCGNSCRR